MGDAASRRGPDPVHRSYRALLVPTDAGRQGRQARQRTDNHELHVDADLVCPRCMEWIEPGDFVRQNRIGLVQHEACG
jgi:hypothetical protein